MSKSLDNTAKQFGNFKTIATAVVLGISLLFGAFTFYSNGKIATQDIAKLEEQLEKIESKVDRNLEKSNEEFKKVLRELLKLSLSLR